MDETKINFDQKNSLIPCIVQDYSTNKVLMLGFMNEEAMERTRAEQRVTFFSRSKQRLWTKGETSGNYLAVKEIKADCDGDTVLIKAVPAGPVCHTGSDTCFGESNTEWSLRTLEQVILDRQQNPKSGSYTSKLFNDGINRIAQKVGEEAVELVISSKDEDANAFMGEAADLIYHFMVLLSARKISLGDVVRVLEQRHKE